MKFQILGYLRNYNLKVRKEKQSVRNQAKQVEKTNI